MTVSKWGLPIGERGKDESQIAGTRFEWQTKFEFVQPNRQTIEIETVHSVAQERPEVGPHKSWYNPWESLIAVPEFIRTLVVRDAPNLGKAALPFQGGPCCLIKNRL